MLPTTTATIELVVVADDVTVEDLEEGVRVSRGPIVEDAEKRKTPPLGLGVHFLAVVALVGDAGAEGAVEELGTMPEDCASGLAEFTARDVAGEVILATVAKDVHHLNYFPVIEVELLLFDFHFDFYFVRTVAFL
jgi:hypothetical protein